MRFTFQDKYEPVVEAIVVRTIRRMEETPEYVIGLSVCNAA